MRTIFLIVFFCGSHFFIFSQNQKIDSLKKIIELHKSDTTACMTYATLCRSLERSQPDAALFYGQQGLMLSKKLHYQRGEIQNTIYIGRVYTNLGNSKLALQLLQESKTKAEQIHDLSFVAACLNNIGRVYQDEKDMETQLNYYKKSNAIAKSIGDEFWMGVTFLNIGTCYTYLNQLDSAKYYLNLSYDYGYTRLKINEMTGFSLASLGNVYESLNEKNLALEYYRSALVFLMKDLVYDGVAETYISISNHYKNLGNEDSSFFYARKAMDYAEQFKTPVLIIEASELLIPKFLSTGKIDSAYYYRTVCSNQKDSLYDSEKRQSMQQFSFEQWRKQDMEEIEKENLKKEKKENIQYWIISITLLVFILLFVMLSGSIIVNEKWISFYGILGLLLLFEFLNLLLHPFLAVVTGHSPMLMLIAMVAIASILIPLHHKIEHWVKHRLVEKNKQIRLKKAKEIIKKLEGGESSDKVLS